MTQGFDGDSIDRDSFDRDYWESHWQRANEHGVGQEIAPNPYLAREATGLTPGTALDAGCGEGAEALWLAARGWQVTAVDISAEVLSRAAERAEAVGAAPERVQWVQADLRTWEPDTQFDLVTTNYAHPAMPQLAFYQRISNWVAPGGTLLVVGHLHTHDTKGHHTKGPDTKSPDTKGHDTKGHGNSHEHVQGRHGQGHGPPKEASVTAAGITAGLDDTRWDVVTAGEHTRTLANRGGQVIQMDDVVVRATRRR